MRNLWFQSIDHTVIHGRCVEFPHDQAFIKVARNCRQLAGFHHASFMVCCHTWHECRSIAVEVPVPSQHCGADILAGEVSPAIALPVSPAHVHRQIDSKA